MGDGAAGPAGGGGGVPGDGGAIGSGAVPGLAGERVMPGSVGEVAGPIGGTGRVRGRRSRRAFWSGLRVEGAGAMELGDGGVPMVFGPEVFGISAGPIGGGGLAGPGGGV